MFLNANLAIVSMPSGLDPDDVIRRDVQEWQALVDKAQPLVDFYFRLIAEQFDLTSAQGKGLAVAEISPLIAELNDEIEKKHYTQQLSRLVQIDDGTIDSRVKAAEKTSKLPTEPVKRRFTDKTSSKASRWPDEQTETSQLIERESTTFHKQGETKSIPLSQEDYLLANLLRDPNLLVWLAKTSERLNITPLHHDELQSVQNQELLKALRRYMSGDEQWDIELFQDTLITHLHGHLANLISYSAKLPQRTVGELRLDTLRTLINLRIQRLGMNAQHLKFMQDDATRQGDMQAAKHLAKLNNQHIQIELNHLHMSKFILPRLLLQSGEFRPSA